MDILRKWSLLLIYACYTKKSAMSQALIKYTLSHSGFGIWQINIPINRSKPIMEFNNKKYHKDVKKCLRIWPQDNDTEGFFVSKIQRI